MADIEVEKITSPDEEILEEWGRVTTEPDLFGVAAVRIPDDDWPWQVYVSVMEFVSEPQASELSAAVTAALSSAPGVTKAVHEDREKWAIKRNANGPALVHAASAVLDGFSAQLRSVFDQLESGE